MTATVTGSDIDRPDVAGTRRHEFRLVLFARMWAVAALLHLVGNARDALVTSTPLAVTSVALGVAAVLTLLTPRRTGRLLALCALVPVTAWYEAPVVGNHWVLASAVSLVVLLAGVVRPAALVGGPGDLGRVVLPTVRLALLLAYGFAAFAKLNTGFLDPAVSCAVYYHDQLVGSWGLDALRVADAPALGRALGVAAAVTELTVTVALALPRARRLGLLLALSFHWLLAMDFDQHFWDFSSVLFAGFVLFLDDVQVDRLQAWCHRAALRATRAAQVLRPAGVALAAVVVAAAVLPLAGPEEAVLQAVGHLAWWSGGTAVLLAVAGLTRVPADPGGRVGLRPAHPVLWLVPGLVVLNGLTPYTEVKTGWGWNMYSNLRTVAGETNHLLVPATLDLTGLQRDQVRVVRSTDPVLQRLPDEGYVMAYAEFREYAHAHPESAVTYERGGRTVDAARLGDDPAGQGGVSALSVRLQSFRVIDAGPEERCQPGFSPAR